jgi:hypothetical protein
MLKTLNNLKTNIKFRMMRIMGYGVSKRIPINYDNISAERIIDVVNQSNNKEWSAGYSNSHSQVN